MSQLFLFICLLFSAQSWGNTGYTLADLEILASEGNHEEFFGHALDIRPSERQETWRSMVLKMADAFSKKVLNQSSVSAQEFKRSEELFAWPVLKGDDVFKLRRQDIGLRYLGTCIKASTPCWEQVKKFWENDPTDPDLAYKLAEITHNIAGSPFSFWTFLDHALKSPLSQFYCQKPFVMDALWGKLELDYVRLAKLGDLLRKIDQTIHPECLSALNKEAQARLTFPKKDGDRELGFQILKAQGKANRELTDFFYTLYLLEKPSQGELFNYAWNGLKELGQSLDRREAVLIQLKKLDPLPDDLMGSLDQTKKRAVLNHFKSYFPEYLDLYANQCVQYYGGKGSFPIGNPTVHCQDLMSSELAPKLLDEYQIQQYQNVRKI